jgi:pimeloyl-ACP methyl ester carboxylesterase
MNWLLLRGLVRERRHWGDFPERLAARTGDRVLTLDLPGVGTERGRPSPTTIAGIVADIRERWLEQRGDGPWRLMAPSLGGMITLAWAEAHPEDFEGVCVCNTSARDLVGVFERFSPAALWTVLRALPSSGATREAHILSLVANTPDAIGHAPAFAAYSAEAPIGVDVLWRQLWAASRAVAPKALSTPLLVLASEGDRLCSPRASRVLAERLGAALHLHPSAGHDLPLDDPEWVVERLAGWVPAAR